MITPCSERAALTNVNAMLLTPAPKIGEIGAYEFRGSSGDVTPPTVTDLSPIGMIDDAVLSTPMQSIQIADLISGTTRVLLAAPPPRLPVTSDTSSTHDSMIISWPTAAPVT